MKDVARVVAVALGMLLALPVVAVGFVVYLGFVMRLMGVIK